MKAQMVLVERKRGIRMDGDDNIDLLLFHPGF